MKRMESFWVWCATVCILALSGGINARAESAEEVFAALRAKADRRIAEIRAAPDAAVPDGAPRRYVSEKGGSDAADGKTPQTAWKTISRLNREKLEPGSYALFERGGLYRGCVMARAGVTYAAYGKGPKPMIFGSPADGADPSKWEHTDNPRVWAYTIGHNDVGTLVFDGGAAHAIKIVIRTDKKTGEKFNKFTGRPFNSYRDLDGDLHFWHDYYKDGTGKLYLYSAKNPGERFKSIEFNVKTCGFRVGGAPDVTIDNFTVKYVGIHGVSAGTCRNLAIRNCEFGWIGGSIQAEGIFGRDYPTRFGNAVEVYGGCDGYVVEDCYIWQVYDAGVTHQVSIPEKLGMQRLDQKNVRYSRNVFEKCNYSIEYFLSVRNGNPSRMENILFDDNLMFDAGYGFCEQRPDRGCASHIKAWFSLARNRATNYVIRNNAMCYGMDVLIQACSGLKNPDGSSSLPKLEGNIFVGRVGDLFGAISDTSGESLVYGPGTQAFVDGFGKGNKCYFIGTRGDAKGR
ncbi:MAG: right-handed parallel beta-helix repeat-containing protein [Kiritimatiellae bacterium]|nr:right-handed parallel beta-helix repeat-containing protein [Kiritimatiellia bacterium]